ncbi:MAG: ATP phosphoribosyltransferase regulatory subunit [Pseudomonadota bacterium]
MDDALKNGLLPEGLRDGLPPRAHGREMIVRQLQDCFHANGYELVAPPLVEFEAGQRGRLDAGQGNSSDAFRLLDPASQKTLIVRSDITRQVARIATTRLSDTLRPLRLAYTGSALRTRGTQLQPSRQVRQVGIELIGPEGPAAARELAQVIAMAFDLVGVEDLTFDLAFPGFIPTLCTDLALSKEQSAQVTAALDDKDAAGLSDLPGEAQQLFQNLLQAVGSPAQVLSAVGVLKLPSKASALWTKAAQLVEVFSAVVGAERLHIDPGEVHGFSYQAGWALSVFSSGTRGELGKGGAYVLSGPGTQEAAQGFTFYPDVFADKAPLSAPRQKICVPSKVETHEILALQTEGYVVVRALDANETLEDQAAQMGCQALYKDGAVTALKTLA